MYMIYEFDAKNDDELKACGGDEPFEQVTIRIVISRCVCGTQVHLPVDAFKFGTVPTDNAPSRPNIWIW